jgi:outer membrane lipoprotein-sorting protein
MRKLLFPLVAVFAFPPTVGADDAADAKAIVAKAIEARGDKPDSKFTATTWKDKGTFTGGGFSLPFTADWAFQAPDKYRFELTGTFGDAKIHLKVVVNGEKAWESSGDMVQEITGEKLEYVRNEAYQFWVTSLTPLATDKGFTLSTAKGKNVEGKATNAVKVARDKKPAITLYFDKETGLLVKQETTVKDEFQKWKEVPEEAYYSDYKEANGRKYFTKLKVVRDGKTMIEATLSDAKEVEKLDAKLFEKP